MGMMRLNLKNKKSNFFRTMILLWFTFTKQNTMKGMALKKLSIQSTNNKQMQQENTKIKFSPFITLEINSSDFSFLSLSIACCYWIEKNQYSMLSISWFFIIVPRLFFYFSSPLCIFLCNNHLKISFLFSSLWRAEKMFGWRRWMTLRLSMCVFSSQKSWSYLITIDANRGSLSSDNL